MTPLSSLTTRVNAVWNSSATGWILFFLFAAWCGWWYWHTPTVGYAIAVLAVAAAVMSALPELGPFPRMAWILILFGFLWIEMRAIRDDKAQSTRELTDHFNALSLQSQLNLQTTVTNDSDHVREILADQQSKFSQTAADLTNIQAAQTRKFADLLGEQKDLFRRQQELAEFLNGKLLPATDPTPATSCGQLQANDVAIFIGSNTYITSDFPHTIFEIFGDKAVSIDKSDTESLVLTVDMRDASNRIIARLNKNGFVVNTAYSFYLLRPDKSTVLIEDQFGKEVLSARFLNPRAFRLSGTLQYHELSVPLEPRGVRGLCSEHNKVDIGIGK